jgi:hypothetical protein
MLAGLRGVDSPPCFNDDACEFEDDSRSLRNEGESCFSLPTTWYAVWVVSHAMFITAVPPYLSGHEASAKRKRDVQRVRGN